ncbi:hypothetical protein KSS87_014014 [Heliosperma pusillum]|nr:hypothetical protein KSS87_014014 [Heliosperma pusillum]
MSKLVHGQEMVVAAIAMMMFFASPAYAGVYKVGDSSGWTTIGNVDYKQWSATKTFRLGDVVGNWWFSHEMCRKSSTETDNDGKVLVVSGEIWWWCGWWRGGCCVGGVGGAVVVVLVWSMVTGEDMKKKKKKKFLVVSGTFWKFWGRDVQSIPEVFQYNPQFHNVMQVRHAAYKECNASAPIATHTTGNDTITITKHGHYFFLCGVPGHCQTGQKVDIHVLKPVTSTSAPSPSVAASPANAATATLSPGPSSSAPSLLNSSIGLVCVIASVVVAFLSGFHVPLI